MTTTAAETARETARLGDGKFGTQAHADDELDSLDTPAQPVLALRACLEGVTESERPFLIHAFTGALDDASARLDSLEQHGPVGFDSENEYDEALAETRADVRTFDRQLAALRALDAEDPFQRRERTMRTYFATTAQLDRQALTIIADSARTVDPRARYLMVEDSDQGPHKEARSLTNDRGEVVADFDTSDHESLEDIRQMASDLRDDSDEWQRFAEPLPGDRGDLTRIDLAKVRSNLG